MNLPTLGPKSISVVVSHTDDGLLPLPPATQIYTVRVIREGTEATDRAALMALYNSAGGASWTINDNWGSTEDLADWFGVTTDSNDRVIQVWLTTASCARETTWLGPCRPHWATSISCSACICVATS